MDSSCKPCINIQVRSYTRGYISWLVGVLENAGSMAQDLVALTCVKIDVTTQRPPRNRMTVLLSLETQDVAPTPPPPANNSLQEYLNR